MDHAMYLIVNNDLPMGKGKVAAQVGHASCAITRLLHGKNNTNYNNWLRQGEAKIVLKATQTEMLELLSKYDHTTTNDANKCVSVHDAGHTQIPANSLTVIGFYPVLKSKAPIEISKLKLL